MVGIVRLLPMRAVLGAGRLLGLTFHALDGQHRRQALRNLESAFPLRSAAERRTIAREMTSPAAPEKPITKRRAMSHSTVGARGQSSAASE